MTHGSAGRSEGPQQETHRNSGQLEAETIAARKGGVSQPRDHQHTSPCSGGRSGRSGGFTLSTLGSLFDHHPYLPEVRTLAPGMSPCSPQGPAVVLLHKSRGCHWRAPGRSFTHVTPGWYDHLGLNLKRVGERGMASLGVCSRRLFSGF